MLSQTFEPYYTFFCSFWAFILRQIKQKAVLEWAASLSAELVLLSRVWVMGIFEVRVSSSSAGLK